MTILICQLVSRVTQDFEGAQVYLQDLQRLHFREYCNEYELLLKAILNIGSANSAMNLYIYNANFNG